MKKFLSFFITLISLPIWAETPIFIMHSYHASYPWTQEQNRAFMAELDNNNIIIPDYSTEYLDTKRIQFDERYEEKTANYLADKYKGYHPKLIYVTDDNALHFMLHNRKTFFPSTPIVFSGINDLHALERFARIPATGVFEKKVVLPNFKLIKSLFPDEQEVMLLGDGGQTAQVIRLDLEREIRDYHEMKINYILTEDFETALAELQKYEGKTIVLTTIGGFRSRDGRLIPIKEVINKIHKIKDFLIISMEDSYVKHGVVGGYAVDGVTQGTQAGKLAIEILTQPKGSLPPSNIDSSTWVFDAKMLEHNDVKLPEEIAKQARYLNLPQTFYQKHEEVIYNALYILGGLLTIVSFALAFVFNRSRKRTEEKERTLAILSNRLNVAQKVTHLGNWEWNIASDSLWWSDEIYRIFGLEPQQFKATYQGFLEYVHPDDREMLESTIRNTLLLDTDYRVVHRIVRANGEIRRVLEEGSFESDEFGKPLVMVGVIYDITDTYEQNVEIDKLSKVVEQIDDSVVVTDKDGTITYVNPAFCIHTGFSKEDAIGQTSRISKSGHHDKEFYRTMWQTILTGNIYRNTFINKTKSGDIYYENKTITPIKDDKNNVVGFVSSGKDVTSETLMHQEMQLIASTDKLTGIYNRHKFEELFGLEVERSQRFNLPLSLILIDIDHFKLVNDNYGHDVGDEVLIELAVIIKKNLRKIDIFARWGGEEFLVLSPGTDLDEVRLLAEKLRLAIENANFPKVGHITVSLGISTYNSDDSLSTLFKRSDRGLYNAKANGRNQIGAA